MVQKTQNMLTDGDRLDMFQHVYREWNQEADHLTHVARKKVATCNSYVMEEGTGVEAARSFFDGGVNIQCDVKIKNQVGSGFVIQVAQRIEESTEKMKSKTIVRPLQAFVLVHGRPTIANAREMEPSGPPVDNMRKALARAAQYSWRR